MGFGNRHIVGGYFVGRGVGTFLNPPPYRLAEGAGQVIFQIAVGSADVKIRKVHIEKGVKISLQVSEKNIAALRCKYASDFSLFAVEMPQNVGKP